MKVLSFILRLTLLTFLLRLWENVQGETTNNKTIIGEWKKLSIQKLSILKVIAVSENCIYATAIDKAKGSILLHSNNGGVTWDELPTTGSNLGMVITNDQQLLCGIGTKIYCIYLKEKALARTTVSYDITEIEMTASPKEIHPFGKSGIAMIGFFKVPFTNEVINGVALKRFDGVSGWEYHDLPTVKQEEGYFAMAGAFPSEKVWFIISSSWQVQNPHVSSMLSGRLNIVADTRITEYHYEFLTLNTFPKGNYQGAISRTIDGGKTWTTVFDSNQRFYLNQIHCYNEKFCLAVGEGRLSSYIIITKDGGNTWEIPLRLWGKYSLHSCKMINEKIMWVAGGITIEKDDVHSEKGQDDDDDDGKYLGIYYHSDDGGETWSMMTLDGYVYDLNFMNENIGYAATIHRDHCEITKFQKS